MFDLPLMVSWALGNLERKDQVMQDLDARRNHEVTVRSAQLRCCASHQAPNHVAAATPTHARFPFLELFSPCPCPRQLVWRAAF